MSANFVAAKKCSSSVSQIRDNNNRAFETGLKGQKAEILVSAVVDSFPIQITFTFVSISIDTNLISVERHNTTTLHR